MTDARTPVIVGVGEVTNRGERIVTPLDLMERAALLAASDAGASVLRLVRSVQVAGILSWSYANPGEELAQRLGLPAGERLTTTTGGSTPQWLMSRACDALARGDVDGVLIVGAEALDSARRAREQHIQLDRGDRSAANQCEVIGDTRPGPGPVEMSLGVAAPAACYPLFESAIAAREGRTPDSQREWLGRVMAPFTEAAAARPELSWFPEGRSPEEISAITPDNRLVGEPYTKRMNAMLRVDQGAALVLTTLEAARSAGVPDDRMVFCWSAAECDDVYHPSERPDLSRSEGIEVAGRAALEAAGLTVDDVAFLDFYSCFPSAVEAAASALGLSPLDPRRLTVTGGLPYFGGPGNNYVAHAIACLAGRLRERPDSVGMVTGVSWYLSRHAVGLYGASPPSSGWRHADCSSDEARIAQSAVPVASEADGSARVEAMTVVHTAGDGPVAAPMLGRLPDGTRVAAHPADDHLLKALSGTSLVGAEVHVRTVDGRVVYEPA